MRVVEELLPQVSVALKVRVWELVQPLVVTVLSEGVTVALPLHVSVAVALPRAVCGRPSSVPGVRESGLPALPWSLALA